MRAFSIDGVEMVVVLMDGKFYAFSNVCTHRNERLTDGFIIDRAVICAAHEATYDLASGDILYGPAFEPLPVYPVRVRNDEVQVEWPVAVLPALVNAVDLDREDWFERAFTI